MAPGDNGYDPIAHLPAGQKLTHDREAALMDAFIANGRRPLTEQQVAAAVGPALPPITSIKTLKGG